MLLSRFVPAVLAVASIASVPLLLTAAPRIAHAQQTLVQNTTAGGTVAGNAAGQSITTPTGGPFNTLIFNFYRAASSNTATTPTAPGTLFILSQEYTGAPSDLSSTTSGYVASVAGSGVLYTLDPAVTLQGGTQYFFYSNVRSTFAISSSNPYSGGTAYGTTISQDYYIRSDVQDYAFRLQGSTAAAAPEPGTLPLVGVGLTMGASVMGMVKRRKAKK